MQQGRRRPSARRGGWTADASGLRSVPEALVWPKHGDGSMGTARHARSRVSAAEQAVSFRRLAGALFLAIGIIYDQTHTRKIADYGGAASVVPIYAAFFMIFTLSSIGLPGTNGFVGEFLIILGGFKAKKLAGVLAATGIIIGAGYMLWLYQRIFFMETNRQLAGSPRLSQRGD